MRLVYLTWKVAYNTDSREELRLIGQDTNGVDTRLDAVVLHQGCTMIFKPHQLMTFQSRTDARGGRTRRARVALPYRKVFSATYILQHQGQFI